MSLPFFPQADTRVQNTLNPWLGSTHVFLNVFHYYSLMWKTSASYRGDGRTGLFALCP